MNFENFEDFCKKNVIGLTGNIATGKSTVAKLISGAGFYIFDADQIARKVVAADSPTLRSIVSEFGAAILNSDGSLNRGKLGQLVFSDASARKILESIMHPAIRQEFERSVRELDISTRKPIFYEAALIVETNQQRGFWELWCVTCSPQSQINRLMTRQKITEQEAKRIISAQFHSSEKEKHCDQIIRTDGPIENVKSSVESLLQELRSRWPD